MNDMAYAINKAIVIVKPDALERKITEKLIVKLLTEFELITIKDVIFTEKLFDKHYQEHLDKDFYPSLKDAMVGKRVFVLALNSKNSKICIREYCEKIREEYVDSQYIGPRNIIHCSDSHKATLREWKIWFTNQTLSW